MNQYIIPNLPAVNEKIEQDLTVIKTQLLKIYGDNIVAILLCGGFGRKEGTIINIDNNFVPFNDYDLLLVTKKRISRTRLSQIGEILAKKLNIRFVDLGAIKETNLSTIPNTIFSFDLASATIIHGQPNILDLIPRFSKENLPIVEADLILYNRLICFLELTPDGFLSKKRLTDSEHKKLVLQLNKPVIAAAIAWLVKAKSYETSYQRQLENFLKLDNDSETKNLVELSYKLKLGLEDPGKVDPWQLWMDARNFFLKTFEAFIKRNQSWDNFYKSYAVSKISIHNLLINLAKLILYQERPQSETMKRQAEIMVLKLILHPDKANWDEAKNSTVQFWFKHHH